LAIPDPEFQKFVPHLSYVLQLKHSYYIRSKAADAKYFHQAVRSRWGIENKLYWCTLNSVADALYVIGGKWKLRIIVALTEGNRRFNEMQRLIDGISAKVLSTELKDLELNGFVRRNVFTGTPVVVEYELTEFAETWVECYKH
jgi:DNA-binding HxlR family transcriptional regulator